MNCWKCKTELIWGSDSSIECDQNEWGFEDFELISYFSCPKCGSEVEFYHKKE